jgi:hypothetical protein
VDVGDVGLDVGGVVEGDAVAEVEGVDVLADAAERFGPPFVQVVDAEVNEALDVRSASAQGTTSFQEASVNRVVLTAPSM